MSVKTRTAGAAGVVGVVAVAALALVWSISRLVDLIPEFIMEDGSDT